MSSNVEETRAEGNERSSFRLGCCANPLRGTKVVVIEIGAGHGIPTVRRKSGELTRDVGAILIRINLDDPELDGATDVGHLREDPAHVSIGGKGALEALQEIHEEWKRLCLLKSDGRKGNAPGQHHVNEDDTSPKLVQGPI